MELIWAIVLIVANLLWLGLVIIGLPGNWLMIGSTLLVAWFVGDFGETPGDRMFSRWVLIGIVGLGLLGEVCELVAGYFGTRQAGGTRQGAIGALVGTLIGGIAGTFLLPVPVIGSLAGACGGAAAGAILMELRSGMEMNSAARSGLGAGIGRFAGTLLKLGFGAAIWIVVAAAAFWP